MTLRTRKKDKASEHWGIRLSSVLKEKKITLTKAAKLAGVPISTLDNWTSGRSPTDFMAVRRLCDELQVNFSFLLTGQAELGSKEPTVAEMFEEVPAFDGIARIKICHLVPRKKKE